MTLGMKKIMVEVPDSMPDAMAQMEIDRASSPDWISFHWWHISDVQDIAGDCTPMSDDEAKDLLIGIRNDANYAIRDVITDHVEKWRDEQ
jgi:hypothetical protein